jgi:hypothetical protein
MAIVLDGTNGVTTNSGTLISASTIGVGGATPSTSGSGITFPATQSASSNANTLDDYEEGTFTPTLASGFSTAPTSYTSQAGRYMKVGRSVFVEIEITPVGAVSNASQVQVGGLPFTIAGGPPFSGATLVFQTSFDTNALDSFVFQTGTTTIQFYTSGGAARDGNAAGVNINQRLIMSGWYTVS